MPSSQPLSFHEAAAKAGVASRVPRGVHPIRVSRIVGSAGKAEKLGPNFLPLAPGPAQANYTAILRRMQAGEDLPPIVVYQLGYRYFVIDGHTRVAAAKALDIEFLDAVVTEALPRTEGRVYVTYYARRDFERHTGLNGIRLTAPWRYHLLYRHVEGYWMYLERSRGREVWLWEAARIWHRTQYLPTLLEIRRRKLESSTGGRTTGDVYTDILKVWAEEEGLAASLREMLDRYDESLKQRLTPVTRARRLVADLLDACIPKALSSIASPRSRKVVELDVKAELEALEEDEEQRAG